jgi:ABC-2 type transport system permease protein
MFDRIFTLTRAELYKMSRQKYSYLLVFFIVINALMVGLGSRIFPAIMAAFRGTEGVVFDGYTFASIIESGTFGSAGAGTICMLAFAGSIMASETDSGTLKNLLTRPVRRGELLAGKALALLVYCLVIVGIMTVISVSAGAIFYHMGDLVIPETGEVYRTQAEMLGNLAVSNLMNIFSIYTVGCMGLLLSVIINNAGWAVITSLVIYFPVAFLKNFDSFSPWIFTAYMDLGQNILREMAVVKAKAWSPDIVSFFAVNISTICVFLLLAFLIFKKKEIY